MKRLIQMNFIRKFTLFIGLSLLLCAVMQAQQPNQRVVRTIEELMEALATPSLRSDEVKTIEIQAEGIAVTEEIPVEEGSFYMKGGSLYRSKDYQGLMMRVKKEASITIDITLDGASVPANNVVVKIEEGGSMMLRGTIQNTICNEHAAAIINWGTLTMNGGILQNNTSNAGYVVMSSGGTNNLTEGRIINNNCLGSLYADTGSSTTLTRGFTVSGSDLNMFMAETLWITDPLNYTLTLETNMEEGKALVSGTGIAIPYQLTEADFQNVIVKSTRGLTGELINNQIVLVKKAVIPDILTTEDELQAAIDASTGTQGNPTEIKIAQTGISLTKTISVGSGKHVTLTGGTIEGSFENFGTMFVVDGNASLSLREITIDGGCTGQEKACCGFAVRGGVLKLEDASIVKGFGLTSDVSVVYISSGSFTMSSGQICDNFFLKDNRSMCSIVYVGTGSFLMNGGEIINNQGDYQLISLLGSDTRSSVELNGGVIAQNGEGYIISCSSSPLILTHTSLQQDVMLGSPLQIKNALDAEVSFRFMPYSKVEDGFVVAEGYLFTVTGSSYQITQADVDKIKLPEGYTAVLQNNQVVVKVGNPEPVFDLQALVDAAAIGTLENPSVITLTEDVVLTKTIEVKGKHIKLAGGKTITATIANSQSLRMFNVTENGSLTLDNVVLDGTAEGYVSFAAVDESACLTLQNGTVLRNAKVKNDWYALKIDGSLVMDQCTFTQNASYGSYALVMLNAKSQWLCKGSIISHNGAYGSNGTGVSQLFTTSGQSSIQNSQITNNTGFVMHACNNMSLTNVTWQDNLCDIMLVASFEGNNRTYVGTGGEPTSMAIIGEYGVNHLMFSGKVGKKIAILLSGMDGCVVAEGYNDYQLTEDDLAQFTLENKEGYTLRLEDNKIVMRAEAQMIDTQAKLQAAINASKGTAENPEVIMMTGVIPISSTITIDGKYVSLTGGTLKKAKSGDMTMFYIQSGFLGFTNTILDGAHDKLSGYCSFIAAYNKGESSVDIGEGTKLTNALGGRKMYIVHANAKLTTLNGGEISGNYSEGGAIIYADRSFIMNSGTLSENKNVGTPYMMNVVAGAGEITINGGTISCDTRNSNPMYLYGTESFTVGGNMHIEGIINMYIDRKFTIAAALVNPITFTYFYGIPSTGHILAVPAKGYTLTEKDLNAIHYQIPNVYGLRLVNGNIVIVNLLAENKTFNVKVADCAHGSVVANKTTAKENEVITVTSTPDEGYKLYSLRYNEVNELTASTSTTNTYTFNMPPMDATISAQFIKKNAVVNPVPENPSDDPDDIQPDNVIGNIEDLIDALDGSDDGTVELTPETKAPTLDEEDPISDSIGEAENEGSVYIGSLEELINVLSKDTKGQVVSSQSLTKLPCKVVLRFTLSGRLMMSQELRAMAESGLLRATGSGNYYILNQCEGEVTKIIPEYDAMTNTLTFETDRLGIFAVMYADGGTANEEVVRIEARVRTVDGQISIEDMPIGEPYAIYELSGKMLQNGVADGTPIRFKPSATGNYVVRCGNMGQIIHFEK